MTSDKCVLPVFDPAKKTALWTDASEFAAGAVLLQLVDAAKDLWKPVSFYSSRFNSAEVNYDVRDRELTAMVKALDTWAPLLLSCHEPFLLITDHRSIGESWATTKLAHRRHIQGVGHSVAPSKTCRASLLPIAASCSHLIF